MQNKKRFFLYAILAIVALLVLIEVSSILLPYLDPNYRNAAAVCTSIKVGMTYSAVQSEYGALFAASPVTYVNDQGTGQVWLNNDSTRVLAHCNIQFTNDKVTAVDFVNEFSF